MGEFHTGMWALTIRTSISANHIFTQISNSNSVASISKNTDVNQVYGNRKTLKQLKLFYRKASVHLNKGKLFGKQLSLPNAKRKYFAPVCPLKMISPSSCT